MEQASEEAHRPRRKRNRRGHGDRLRNDLIAAAGRLMDAGGEEAITMRAVTNAVGAAPQSIYAHFGDKEQLLWAVLRERFRELASDGDAAEAAAGADPVARLRARCLALGDYGLNHPRRYQHLLTRAAPTVHNLPIEDLPGGATFKALETAVRAVLAEDTPHGEAFAKTTDLLATVHGAVLLQISMPSFPWPAINDVIDRAVAHLLDQRSVTARP